MLCNLQCPIGMLGKKDRISALKNQQNRGDMNVCWCCTPSLAPAPLTLMSWPYYEVCVGDRPPFDCCPCPGASRRGAFFMAENRVRSAPSSKAHASCVNHSEWQKNCKIASNGFGGCLGALLPIDEHWLVADLESTFAGLGRHRVRFGCLFPSITKTSVCNKTPINRAALGIKNDCSAFWYELFYTRAGVGFSAWSGVGRRRKHQARTAQGQNCKHRALHFSMVVWNISFQHKKKVLQSK